MGSYVIIATAANATAGTDLFAAASQDAGQVRMSDKYRQITEIGFVGSTAIADCGFRLLVNGQQHGVYYNTTAGASKIPVPLTDIKVLTKPIAVPKGALIQAIMTASAATNAVALHIELSDFTPAKSWGGSRRGSGRRRRF